MEKILIEPTKDTPFVKLEEGIIEIQGRSIIEDPKVFYLPVYDWVSRYVKNPPHSTLVDLRFEYINTSSTKWVFNLLKVIGEEFDPQKDMHITWQYEHGDDDMLELGKIFESLVKRPFQFIEVEE